jgi:hypothetical protein
MQQALTPLREIHQPTRKPIGGNERQGVKSALGRPFSNLNPAVVRCNSDKAFLDDCLVRAIS